MISAFKYICLFIFISISGICNAQNFDTELQRLNSKLSNCSYFEYIYGVNIEYTYFIHNANSNELIINETIIRNYEVETREYIFNYNILLINLLEINLHDKGLLLQYSHPSNEYAKGIKYRSTFNGNTSVNEENQIIIKIKLSQADKVSLKQQFDKVFELFLQNVNNNQNYYTNSKDISESKDSKIDETDYSASEYNNMEQISVSDSDTEYYSNEKKRVYNKDFARYYRTLEKTSYGYQSTWYFINGNKYFEGGISFTDHMDLNNDQFSSSCTWFYENGNKNKKANYINGNEHGNVKIWYDTGELYADIDFEYGEMNGYFTTYYKSGDVHLSAETENGNLINNTYTECDEEGICQEIFEEDFNTNNYDWDEDNNTEIECEVSNGFYRLQSKDGTSFVKTIDYEINQDRSFIIESEIYFHEGTTEEGHGIVWGYYNSDNYYCFEITSDGYYRILGYFDGIKTVDTKWKRSEDIKKDKSWNKLQINKYADNIYFSINGELVHQDEYYHYKGNSLGLIVRGKKRVAIDNFIIKSYLSGNKSNTKNEEFTGSGTGVIFTIDGYVLTNHHVIEGAKKISIEINRNNIRRAYNGRVILSDEENDLAIIKITDNLFTPFSYIPFKINYSDLKVGSSVFALGYPYASIIGEDIRFNEGTISSRTGFQGNQSTYQMSVPIQPGNSGSPLFDKNGNLAGLVYANLKLTDNISYAIKSKIIIEFINKVPYDIKIPNNNTIHNLELTSKINVLQDYVPIIKIRK